MKLDPEMFQT